MTIIIPPPSSAVSHYDARPFFEKALVYGVQNGIIDQSRLDAINQDAPKGMVQIARYFGSEFLRPELEKAKDRLINLVSLHLEHVSGGDLRQAAQMLRDHSLLSRSKAGSDMLKALIAMPQNSHFGMNEHGGFKDRHIPSLAKWSLKSLQAYQTELGHRSQAAHMIEAAIWLAGTLGLDVDELEEAGKDAEAVIRTALLVHTGKRTKMPDWVGFEKMVGALRKKPPASIAIPKDLPKPLMSVVQSVRQSVMADLPRILDAGLPARKLFDQTPAFMGRYFWLEDGLSEVDGHDRAVSEAWHRATGGHTDDSSLLTLWLCLAAGSAARTVLTEQGATALIRKIRKNGLQADLASQYILDHAPAQHQPDYARLWLDFLAEALPTLQGTHSESLNEALSLLRRECHVKTRPSA